MDIAALSSSTASASARASSQLTANFDTFLTLLTTQLRNQDPLEPLDTEKFTEQLVQFANVEQSIQTNQHLEALLALQSASNNETALALVGRIASVDSNVAALGDNPARWRVTLPENAAASSAKILDASGATVAELKPPVTAGAHDIVWDGVMDAGGTAPAGAYSLVVAAVDSDGAPLNTSVSTRGRVDGIAFNNGAPEIEIAGQTYSLDLVTRADADI